MKLEKISLGLQGIGQFFDRAFQRLTFSNFISALSGAFLLLAFTGTGWLAIVYGVVGFALFFSAGLLLTDKEDVEYFISVRNETTEELSKLKKTSESLQEQIKKFESSKSLAEPTPPLSAPTLTGFGSSGYYNPHAPPRRKVVTITEEDNRTDRKEKDKAVSPSTPPRPRRKTGA